MSVVVTLLDFRPPERSDGVPWASWVLEEAGAETGPWTQIDSGPLIPVDHDPEAPAARDITTELGSGLGLWYRVKFLDSDGDSSGYSDAIENTVDAIYPTLREVALHIRSRTIERVSNKYLGTFTDSTFPTAADALETIDAARDDVLTDTGKLPNNLQIEGFNGVRKLIALRAAMIIERSFYGDQIGTNKSPYTALERDYNNRLTKVVTAIEEAEALGEIKPGDPLGADTSGGGTGTTPQDSYAVDAGARLWLGTAWSGTATPQHSFPDDPGSIDQDTQF